jgi:hypothetical protein
MKIEDILFEHCELLPLTGHLASPLQMKMNLKIKLGGIYNHQYNTIKIHDTIEYRKGVKYIQTIMGRSRPVLSSIFNTIAGCSA